MFFLHIYIFRRGERFDKILSHTFSFSFSFIFARKSIKKLSIIRRYLLFILVSTLLDLLCRHSYLIYRHFNFDKSTRPPFTAAVVYPSYIFVSNYKILTGEWKKKQIDLLLVSQFKIYNRKMDSISKFILIRILHTSYNQLEIF